MPDTPELSLEEIAELDPEHGECPKCEGYWMYSWVKDGEGRSHFVEASFVVIEPCEVHKGE